MNNQEIAELISQIGELLEIKGENPFKIRAYEKASQVLESLPEELESIYKEKGLKGLEFLPSIGSGIAGKIEEIIKTGKLKQLEELHKQIPEGVAEMMSISTLGPKKAKILFDELGIKSIDQLEKAAREHKLAKLPGFGPTTEKNVLKGIKIYRSGKERMRLGDALPLAQSFVQALKKMKEVKEIEPAGSLRRRRDTVRDIDILTTSSNPKKVMNLFQKLSEVSEILAVGETKSSIRTKTGMQVDLRVVEPESFGAALCYFTGSKSHNIRLRELAMKKGLKINEYGVFKGKKRIAGRTEQEVYKAIDLPFVFPELREDRGEVEAALKKKLPRLIEASDIKGDLHVHSTYSDGADSLEELAAAGRAMGYKYLAVTDHSQSLKVAGGLSPKELIAKTKEIKKLNSKLKGFTLLAGTEVDIKKDGRIDYDAGILKDLDIVIASVHDHFKLDKKTMTRRIIRAMENKYVHTISHLTGRMIGQREEYELDFSEILKAARDTNTALELNAHPVRLDLNDIALKAAKEAGVMISIGTDAHHVNQLNFMNYGLSTARRGWLEPKNVLNTLTVDKLSVALKK